MIEHPNYDDEDVAALLARDTADGSGFHESHPDPESDLPPSDLVEDNTDSEDNK